MLPRFATVAISFPGKEREILLKTILPYTSPESFVAPKMVGSLLNMEGVGECPFLRGECRFTFKTLVLGRRSRLLGAHLVVTSLLCRHKKWLVTFTS